MSYGSGPYAAAEAGFNGGAGYFEKAKCYIVDMKWPKLFRDRGETTAFSKSNYEVLFSVFMVALAYLYRENPLIAFPEVLYLFMSLLAVNFAFNRIFAEKVKVKLWLVDIMLLSNIGVIAAILSKSGGHLSFFWVLFLLPIFTAALTGSLPEVVGATALSLLTLGALSADALRLDTAQLFAFSVKASVFVFSAFITFRTSLARRRLETEVTFKRFQVEKLLATVSERDSKAQSEASAAEVGRMTASLLHDIGNVITIILLTAEIMVQDETPSPKDAKHLERAAKMGKSIIDGALAIIKGARYEFRSAPIREPMENAAAMFARQAGGREVKILVSAGEDLPELKLSVPHMQRVFINGITNALSFLQPGGTITLRAALAGEEILVSIEDDGPGFPPALLESGITQFGTTRQENGGTGLGLFNSKEIVEKHGGKFSIRNRRPSGAVLEFTLPLSGRVK
ncbi:MAG: hypothetical protein COT18_07935 [Elusimicrobia bacterium CG08_land_8_20_14_0_20_59_10]|nr:MAG: hypothetical protein COT18_07935 [Elusimicrobia bacterium CG08_land_8_20_14_0_20_59_10]